MSGDRRGNRGAAEDWWVEHRVQALEQERRESLRVGIITMLALLMVLGIGLILLGNIAGWALGIVTLVLASMLAMWR